MGGILAALARLGSFHCVLKPGWYDLQTFSFNVPILSLEPPLKDSCGCLTVH